MSEAPLRVVHVPRTEAPSSYVALLIRSLQADGVRPVAPTGSLWHIGCQRCADVVHLHWLEFIAPSDGRPVSGVVRTLVRQARLATGIVWLRLRGIKVVWTVHNLAPHEPVRPRLERILGRVTSRLVHRVIAHSDYARSRIQERWGRSTPVTVIPHPNYIDVFPPDVRPRREIRRSMGLPEDAFVFLAFGQVRPYKRLADLAAAFGTVAGDNLRLLIVGKPVVPEETARLRAAAAADERVLLRLREVADDEVSGLHRCADAAVIAYRDVFSSGALLLALSFGLPVVAGDIGTAAELVGSEAGELFSPGGLPRALDAASRADQQARTAAAAAIARRYGWDRVGSETANLYRRLSVRTGMRLTPSHEPISTQR